MTTWSHASAPVVFLFSKPQTGGAPRSNIAATASMLERYKVAVEERVNLKHVHRRLQAPRLLPPLGRRGSEFTASVSVRWLPSF